MRNRQRGAIIVLVMLSIALAAAVVVGSSRRTAVALAASNSCKSNATGTFSDITVGLTGTAAWSGATDPANSVTLSGVKFTAAVPATLLIAGYNLGLLTVGSNSIPVKGWVSIAGSGTVDVKKTLQFSTTVSTTITDPNGIPGNGDEGATPLNLDLALADTTWTPTGGTINFSQGAPGSLAPIPAGQVSGGVTNPVGGVYISAQVAGGLIKANFDCQGGVSAVGGASFTPSTPGTFASTTATVTGGISTTAPVTTTPSATTTPASSTTTPASTTPGTTTPATTAPAPTTTLPSRTAGSSEYITSCKNSVTPDLSELVFTASGSAPAEVAADSSFDVTKMKWSVTIPAGVFQTGINFGLITPGTSIDGELDIAITGTNTAQSVQDPPKIDLVVPVKTSNGQALPSTVKFDVPDMTWTARSGKINFLMYGANVSVKIGLPSPVVFVCKPVKGGAFASTTAVGVSTATTTIPATTTTAVASEAPTTTTPGQLVVTGAGSTLVQVLIALLFLDLGYLVLSLRRQPRSLR